MLCPWQVCQLQPPPAAVDDLRLFPFLDDDVTVNALKQELPAFRAAAEDVTGVDPAKWWKNHADELPSWSSAAAKVFLVQPSSAAAERVFSLLQPSISAPAGSGIRRQCRGQHHGAIQRKEEDLDGVAFKASTS